jgi:hypothetical protein
MRPALASVRIDKIYADSDNLPTTHAPDHRDPGPGGRGLLQHHRPPGRVLRGQHALRVRRPAGLCHDPHSQGGPAATVEFQPGQNPHPWPYRRDRPVRRGHRAGHDDGGPNATRSRSGLSTAATGAVAMPAARRGSLPEFGVRRFVFAGPYRPARRPQRHDPLEPGRSIPKKPSPGALATPQDAGR